MKTPKQINIKFTERDRQGAGTFTDNNNCLLGYALRRRGYQSVSVLVVHAMINGVEYSMPYFGPTEACDTRLSKPFYDKRIVGRTITLTRRG